MRVFAIENDSSFKEASTFLNDNVGTVYATRNDTYFMLIIRTEGTKYVKEFLNIETGNVISDITGWFLRRTKLNVIRFSEE